MDMSKFTDRRVHFRNSGVKGLMSLFEDHIKTAAPKLYVVPNVYTSCFVGVVFFAGGGGGGGGGLLLFSDLT